MHSRLPPAPPDDGDDPGRTWARQLAVELARAGVPVRCDYPVGPWLVDVCAGTGAGAVGLICAVHPDGPAAHLSRQRALREAGWRLLDTFPSRWQAIRWRLPLRSPQASMTVRSSSNLPDRGCRA